jgi:hypothetical protein
VNLTSLLLPSFLQTKGVENPCNVRGRLDVYIEVREPLPGSEGVPSTHTIFKFEMDSLEHEGHTPNEDLYQCGAESIFPPSALAFCRQVRSG